MDETNQQNFSARQSSVGELISRKSSRKGDETVAITWKDIQFETLLKDPARSTILKKVYKKKTVLNGLSGKAKSGELLAILGPTGKWSNAC